MHNTRSLHVADNSKSLLEAWSDIDPIFAEYGGLSVHLVAAHAGAPKGDISRFYGEEVPLAASEETQVLEFCKNLAHAGSDADCESFQLSRYLLVETEISGMSEIDRILHRRGDLPDAIEDIDGEMQPSQIAKDLLHVLEALEEGVSNEDPVRVLVHDQEGAIELAYQRSFGIPGAAVADLPIESHLAKDDEELQVELVCDVHHAPFGARSFTISRLATTHDGRNRSIVFNDLLLESGAAQA